MRIRLCQYVNDAEFFGLDQAMLGKGKRTFAEIMQVNEADFQRAALVEFARSAEYQQVRAEVFRKDDYAQSQCAGMSLAIQ
jgi:membrane protein required for beta-lactamase induction